MGSMCNFKGRRSDTEYRNLCTDISDKNINCVSICTGYGSLHERGEVGYGWLLEAEGRRKVLNKGGALYVEGEGTFLHTLCKSFTTGPTKGRELF